MEPLTQTEEEATYRVETRLENPYPHPPPFLREFPPGLPPGLSRSGPRARGIPPEAALKPKKARLFTNCLALRC
jgi:hypothetical protein